MADDKPVPEDRRWRESIGARDIVRVAFTEPLHA